MPRAFTTKKELEDFVLAVARMGFDDENLQRRTSFAEDLQTNKGTVEVFTRGLKNMLKVKRCNVSASAASLTGKSKTVGDLSDAIATDIGLA